MALLRCGLVVFTLLWSRLALSQSAEWVTIGSGVRAFHEDVFQNRQIKLEIPVVVDAELIIELIGMPNLPKLNAMQLQICRSVGLQNALAYYGAGYRTIVFDPDWAASQTADFYRAIGHELGHLFCGHLDKPQSPETELEADRFGGAAIKRFEVYHGRNFFASVMAAASAKYPETASALYPSRTARLQALRDGYEKGSPCGDLAPVVEGGFSRGIR